MTDLKKELFSIRVSVAGSLSMALLGVGFALLTASEAIMLDGLFSLIGFALGLLSLKVSKMVRQPDDDRYPFGYASFEPLLNLCKGLIMGFLSLLALYSAVVALWHGGRAINTGAAIVYAATATIGCFGIALYQRKKFRETSSPIVEVDYKNWVVDGAVSAAVGMAFVAAWLMSGTSWEPFLPYVDPAVVILIVIITLWIPYEITHVNLRELLNAAPDPSYLQGIETRIAPLLSHPDMLQHVPRLLKMGRNLYLNLYVVVAPGSRWQALPEQDSFRENVKEALAGTYPNLVADVVFTEDARWAFTPS